MFIIFLDCLHVNQVIIRLPAFGLFKSHVTGWSNISCRLCLKENRQTQRFSDLLEELDWTERRRVVGLKTSRRPPSSTGRAAALTSMSQLSPSSKRWFRPSSDDFITLIVKWRSCGLTVCSDNHPHTPQGEQLGLKPVCG